MSFGDRLREERQRRKLSQEELAEAVGISRRSIARWEHNQAIPRSFALQELSRFFGLNLDEFVQETRTQTPAPSPLLWSVPYPRNPFFTGRDEILHQLHERLNQQHRMALTQSWAVTGLGGIGKTQIAPEYAYVYQKEYRYIFWMNAATQETLDEDFVALAHRLHLPEEHEQDQKRKREAVKQWLATHKEWLCILDNADDVALVQDVVPSECAGHLLLTSRAQAWGALAQHMEVGTMGMAEATLFLLRRAKWLASDTFLDQVPEEHLAAAEAIVLDLDFLPLALDQAGAYIEEVGCSLEAYLELYREHRQALLRRRGNAPTHYPESVSTTWSLSFEKVKQKSPTAADLLRVCAFLEADTIPEEVFSEGGMHLGSLLQCGATDAILLNEAIAELRTFSLVQRHADTRTLSIHRLVQAVLKDAMPEAIQRQWAERVVRALHAVLPQNIEMDTWFRCWRLLAQIQMSSQLIKDYEFTFSEATSLLFRAATFLKDISLYEQAERLHRQVLLVREQELSPSHLDMATSLYHLAQLAYYQAKHDQAEQLYQRALSLQEAQLGRKHPEVARTLVGLAHLFIVQSKYEQAEHLLQQALPLLEQALGPEHLDVANALLRWARLSYLQGNDQQTERLARRALHIRQQRLGDAHPDVAFALLRLAASVGRQGNYEEAERLYRQALQINERALGPDHLDVAQVLNNLADLYEMQGEYSQAESLYQRALQIWERALGDGHDNVAFALNNLAHISFLQGKYAQVEPLYQRALAIYEKQFGPEHVETAETLNGLANLYREQGKYSQAEPLYQQALRTRKHLLGDAHPNVANTLHDLAKMYQDQGKDQQAEPLYQQAQTIYEQRLGPDHPKTIKVALDRARSGSIQ